MKDLLVITPSRGRPQRLREMLDACLAYVPDVVIEHVHFRAGKAPADNVYTAAESWTEADRAAYRRWREQRMRRDVMRVRSRRAMGELREAARP